MITCPNCGKQNRPTAKFCQHCGADFSPTRALSSAAPARGAPSQSPPGVSGLVQKAFHQAQDKMRSWVAGEEPPPASTRPLHESERPTAAQTAPQLAVTQVSGRLRPLQRGSVLSHPQDPRRRYSIVTARELPRSTYYDALDLTCPACQMPQGSAPSDRAGQQSYTQSAPPSVRGDDLDRHPPVAQHALPGEREFTRERSSHLREDGLCQRCHTPLQPVLIHERRARANRRLSNTEIEQLIGVSADCPNVLLHRAILQYEESVYTVVEHPGRWGVLVRGRQQRSSDEALAGVVQVAQALGCLHTHGFAHSEVGGASIESLIVAVGEGSLKLADLGACVRIRSDDDQVRQAQISSDIAFLAWLLFYLATGEELSRTSIEFAPPTLRPFVERAMQKQYASVRDLVTDFSRLPSAPILSTRSLKPSHGQATSPGRKYAHNEDAVVTFTFDKEQKERSVPVGFYLVADGMGGHDAGDLASRTVNQIVTDWIIQTKVLPDLRKTTRKLTSEDVPGTLLSQAVQQANDALLSHGQAQNSDLGSTVTAALIIGDVATIANVGDSRTYLLRDGQLKQVTQDHSLVARLVDAGVIKPEDVRTHPQRNQIHRCLGQRRDVEVDTFTRQLKAGDTLVLCSDGLWEMVSDVEIQRIVEGASSPQKACDALVEAANRAGGEDNVTAVVVEME